MYVCMYGAKTFESQVFIAMLLWLYKCSCRIRFYAWVVCSFYWISLALRFDFYQNIIDKVHRKCLSVAKSLKTLMTLHINTDTVLQLTLALIYNIVCETMSTLNAFISIDDWIWFTQQQKNSVFVFIFLIFTLCHRIEFVATKQNCPDPKRALALLCCVKQWNIKQC